MIAVLPGLLLTTALASTTASGPGVGLLRMSGQDGELLRDRVRGELEPEFAIRLLALDAAETMQRLRCTALYRACLLALGVWLARAEPTSARYPVIETEPCSAWSSETSVAHKECV